MRTLDPDIPHEFEIKIQNIVASANLGKTLNLEAVALDLENTEYEPEQFPGLGLQTGQPKSGTTTLWIWKGCLYWS